jgi:hypothetical protein
MHHRPCATHDHGSGTINAWLVLQPLQPSPQPALLAAVPASASPAAAFTSTAANIHRFVGIQPRWGHTFTAAELNAIGAQNDIRGRSAGLQVNKYGPALRAVNPAVRFYVYQNGMLAGADQANAFPSSWYLHSLTGARRFSPSPTRTT